jgi:phenylacetate-CoA ligase
MSRTERTIGNTLYVNVSRIPFLLKEDVHARMAEEIASWAPQFLDTDPVHAAWFALYCEKHGLRFPSLKFILGSYEYVSVVHRRILERVFGVPVFNLYGSTETGHLLMEDAAGQMRVSSETAFLEIVSPDQAGVGDLVVTTLSNDFMPLVRYRIGDLVQQQGAAYIVHGRARDALRRADGQRVTTHDVDRCFTNATGVAHYQLLQETDGTAQLDIIPENAGLPAKEWKEVAEQIQSLLQLPRPLKVKTMDSLLPTPSGKFRLTHQA